MLTRKMVFDQAMGSCGGAASSTPRQTGAITCSTRSRSDTACWPASSPWAAGSSPRSAPTRPATALAGGHDGEGPRRAGAGRQGSRDHPG